jgi:cytosine/adenosine deaminase-related metal-dependent hydrolase
MRPVRPQIAACASTLSKVLGSEQGFGVGESWGADVMTDENALKLSARWVVPIAGPPIRGGAVVVEAGRITYVGPEHSAPLPAGCRQLDWPNAAICPGFINTHCHIGYTCLRGHLTSKCGFEVLEELGRRKSALTEAELRESARTGAGECLSTGITTLVTNVGAYAPEIVEECLNQGMRVHAYLAVRGKHTDERIESAVAALQSVRSDADRLTIGLAPHALYSFDPERLRALVTRARMLRLRLSIHLAEFHEELRFFNGIDALGAGSLERALRDNFRDRRFGRTPVEVAQRIGILGEDVLAVHCSWIDERDIDILAETRTSVVVCPSSTLSLGNRLAPLADLRSRHVRLCIGTDSAATSGQYDIPRELSLLAVKSSMSDVSVGDRSRYLMKMATLNGAIALGVSEQTGTLVPGLAADLVVMKLDADGASDVDDPHILITERGNVSSVLLTMIDGRVAYQRAIDLPLQAVAPES